MMPQGQREAVPGLSFALILIVVAPGVAAQLQSPVQYNSSSGFPFPFWRVLKVEEPAMSGKDITVAQNLLLRSPYVTDFRPNGVFDQASELATMRFQKGNELEMNGQVNNETAALLMALHQRDGFRDNGTSARALGYLYKIHIPVYRNRSIETMASLLDADNNLLHRFRVRCHGYRDGGYENLWPDYSNDIGLNMLTSNGNTITGLHAIDLNSPEDNSTYYGPYPVNRIVYGLEGNGAFLLPHVRDGLLLHTGDWEGWTPDKPMPNAEGCIHAGPDDIKMVFDLLTIKLNVDIRPNPGNGSNYAFQPQGIMAVEQLD